MDSIIEQISVNSQNAGEPKWLLKRRLEALEMFETVPEPSFKYGPDIVMNSNIRFKIPESEKNPKKINSVLIGPSIAMTLAEAARKEKWLKDKLFTEKPETKADALHQAFWGEGIFIKTEGSVNYDEVLRIESTNNSEFRAEHIIILAEELSKISIIKRNTGSPGLKTEKVQIYSKKGAEVNYGNMQNLGKLSKSISAFEGNVERDSNINWMTCDLGALFAKTTLNSKLKESGASTTQYGLFFGRNDQKYDIHMHSEHIGKNTNSKLHVIGALDGKSKAVSRGFIKIREGASNSEGFQEEETLLLSEKAEASAVPYLEIDNNDVRCSHATSIGQLDEDAIFYSMTRGLSKNEAKKLQVGGFFDAFVQKMEPEFAKDIRKLIDGKVEEINDS